MSAPELVYDLTEPRLSQHESHKQTPTDMFEELLLALGEDGTLSHCLVRASVSSPLAAQLRIAVHYLICLVANNPVNQPSQDAASLDDRPACYGCSLCASRTRTQAASDGLRVGSRFLHPDGFNGERFDFGALVDLQLVASSTSLTSSSGLSSLLSGGGLSSLTDMSSIMSGLSSLTSGTGTGTSGLSSLISGTGTGTSGLSSLIPSTGTGTDTSSLTSLLGTTTGSSTSNSVQRSTTGTTTGSSASDSVQTSTTEATGSAAASTTQASSA